MGDSVGHYNWELKFNTPQNKLQGFITVPSELVIPRHIDTPYGKTYYSLLTPHWVKENNIINELKIKQGNYDRRTN